MINTFLALILALVSPSLFAQSMSLGASEKMWKPSGFSSLSNLEQNIISNLSPINQRNKTFVQLMFDTGSYENCGVGTALRQNKIFISIVDKKTKAKSAFVVPLQEALVNEMPFYEDAAGNVQIYVVVFDRVVPGMYGTTSKETVFMYISFKKDGTVKTLTVNPKKDEQTAIQCIGRS